MNLCHRPARVRPASPMRNACHTQPDNAREAHPQTKRTTEEVSSASTETHNDTRGAYRPRGRRVPQNELASYPRGARRPKPKPTNRPARVRPASPRRNACHTQPYNAREAYPQTKRTTEEVSSASTETYNDTRGAYRPRGRRVPQKELASYPRGARRLKPKPNHRPAHVRPASPRRNACHTQPDNACEAYPQTKRTTEEVSSASTETHNDTRGAYRPRGRRVRPKELASHPRGARRPKSKPNNLTTRVRPISLRQRALQ